MFIRRFLLLYPHSFLNLPEWNHYGKTKEKNEECNNKKKTSSHFIAKAMEENEMKKGTEIKSGVSKALAHG